MIKVMIIDDSAVVRAVMSEILASAAGIEVVATAADPIFARDKLKTITPDVITLDIEMPRMDGITFLKKLMAYKPIPVLMISSLTTRGAQTTLEALAAGAVDFVSKPTDSGGDGLQNLAQEIISKVRTAAASRVHRKSEAMAVSVAQRYNIDELLEYTGPTHGFAGPPVVCVGASTGGTVAIEKVLSSLRPPQHPIVIVQHMPELYTHAFASRLDGLSELEVVEAEHHMPAITNRVIIAKGGIHCLLQRFGNGYRVELKAAPPVNRHKPSVDMLFRSAANSAGSGAMAVILTGMGDDGARGLLDLKKAGAPTFAQNEATCVVYGMPAAAVRMDAVRKEVSLDDVASVITQFSRRRM